MFPDEVDAAGREDGRSFTYDVCEFYRDLLYTIIELLIWKVPTDLESTDRCRLSGDSTLVRSGPSDEKEERWQTGMMT